MNRKNILSLFFIGTSLSACITIYQAAPSYTIVPPGKNKNVCKELSGNVLVYGIFVDSKQSLVWSEHDMNSTRDSVDIALEWLSKQASLREINVRFSVLYHENKKILPIAGNFPKGSMSQVLSMPRAKNGKHPIDTWSNKIAKEAAKSLPRDTSKTILTKNSLKDRERLVARLRDLYNTDKVVLIYFINNYFKNERSVSVYTNTDFYTEFSIVSYKSPAVIAYEILHIFGAVDLYPEAHRFQGKKRSNLSSFDYAALSKEFPNEIMNIQHKAIENLMISPISEYMIGWKPTLENCYTRLLYSRSEMLSY